MRIHNDSVVVRAKSVDRGSAPSKVETDNGIQYLTFLIPPAPGTLELTIHDVLCKFQRSPRGGIKLTFAPPYRGTGLE